MLANHGAALDAVDEDGNGALDYAIRGRKKKNMECLLNLGAPIANSVLVA